MVFTVKLSLFFKSQIIFYESQIESIGFQNPNIHMHEEDDESVDLSI